MEGWIKIVERELTAEERAECDEECTFMYDCALPDDGQDVLITTYRGEVVATTFYTDMGCYFEYYEDPGEVLAWMPFPKPFCSVG